MSVPYAAPLSTDFLALLIQDRAAKLRNRHQRHRLQACGRLREMREELDDAAIAYLRRQLEARWGARPSPVHQGERI